MSLSDSARQLAATLVATGRQRLELAALDVEEEVLRAGRALACMLAITAFCTLALAAASAAVVVALWDRGAVVALAGLALIHGTAAAIMARRLVRQSRTKPPFLAATLRELRQDAQPAAESAA